MASSFELQPAEAIAKALSGITAERRRELSPDEVPVALCTVQQAGSRSPCALRREYVARLKGRSSSGVAILIRGSERESLIARG